MSKDRKRLPGSEKLTRPEDIDALSKYLGNIKKTQEEHTELDTDNLEIPGRITGRVPEIKGLPEEKDELEDSRHTRLEDFIDLLDTPKSPTLDNRRLDLEDKQNLLLDTRRENLDISKKEREHLEEGRLDLDVTTETTLENNRLKLDPDSKNIELDDKTELLKVNQNTKELNNTRQDLEVEENLELNKDKITVDDNRDSKLSQSKLDLDVKDSPELTNTRVDLNTEEKTELDRTKINLGTEDKADLDETKISLGIENKKLELSDYIDTIDNKEDISLNDKRLDLEKKEATSLYDSVISGPSQLDVELEDSRVDLEDKGVEDLNNSRIGLENVKETEGLYDTVLETPKNPDQDEEKKELYDSIMMAPDDQKYEKALEIASSLGPWGLKVSSLISSVLSNDSINSKTAAWLDSELKKLLKQMGAMSDFTIDNYEFSGERAKKLKANEKERERLNGNGSGPEDDNYRNEVNYYDPDYLKKEFAIKHSTPEHDRKINENGSIVSQPDTSNPDFLQNYANSNEVARPIGVDDNKDGINDREAAVEEAFVESSKPNYIYGKWSYGGNVRNNGYRTIPKYQLPSRGILDASNLSNYIRFGVEELFSLWDPSTKAERVLKPMLLNESLALLILAREQLEKLSKANRERLPGDNMGLISDAMGGGVSGMIDNLKNNTMSALQNTFAGVDGVDKLNPLNRPRTTLRNNGGAVTWVKEVTKEFDKGNNRQDPQLSSIEGKNLAKNLGKNLVNSLVGGLSESKDSNNVINFKDKYINNYGTLLTLSELCELSNPRDVDSVEALMKILKEESSHITTPSKFGTIEEGRYGSMTLDTNSFWEVVIEPFCHKSMNGGFSFLPSIDEINTINLGAYGVNTKYSKWIPVVNFELQKSKLTNKSIGLYDGEIVYPVTSELSNELRMTIVDDQYKSWRTYFQKCVDVSVYSSEAHPAEYYFNLMEEAINSFGAEAGPNNMMDPDKKKYIEAGSHITVVDKSNPLVALYKNITFLIKIYIMTPQYTTIRKFNLLCVLKDFEESYSGDIDSGGYDLNLSFSIVGENPPADSSTKSFKKDTTKTLDEMLGTEEKRNLLNQAPKRKGGLIKLL